LGVFGVGAAPDTAESKYNVTMPFFCNIKHTSWCADAELYIYTYQSVNHDRHITLLKTYAGNQVSVPGAFVWPYRNRELKTLFVSERGRSFSLYNGKCNNV
jgi:hypothetical protein